MMAEAIQLKHVGRLKKTANFALNRQRLFDRQASHCHSKIGHSGVSPLKKGSGNLDSKWRCVNY